MIELEDREKKRPPNTYAELGPCEFFEFLDICCEEIHSRQKIDDTKWLTYVYGTDLPGISSEASVDVSPRPVVRLDVRVVKIGRSG